MQTFDLCFAWNWQYDQDFVRQVVQVCQAHGISLLEVTPTNLDETLQLLADQSIQFKAFFDRASDTDQRFFQLIEWACQEASLFINPYWSARRAWDKAAMHKELVRSGLETPYTLILPPYLESPTLSPPGLELMEGCFAIKPAHGGGGKGVITRATCWEQVLSARQEFPTDQYLLQDQVDPILFDGRPAWFRIIYCAEKIYPCWWDPCTHIYTPLTDFQISHYRLDPLLDISTAIAGICRLELFSTEIAYTVSGQFLVVDYVNDPIDLRCQSTTPEGVPDHIVAAIACELVSYVESQSHVVLSSYVDHVS